MFPDVRQWPWPSYISLIGTGSDQDGAGFVTDHAGWAALDNAQHMVELEVKKGKRLEVWVTAAGRLKTSARPAHSFPCDRVPGFGHLGYIRHNWL
jgi:hypothetical protein